jgi:hypothetical protein
MNNKRKMKKKKKKRKCLREEIREGLGNLKLKYFRQWRW